jgi:hypothetical protein
MGVLPCDACCLSCFSEKWMIYQVESGWGSLAVVAWIMINNQSSQVMLLMALVVADVL